MFALIFAELVPKRIALGAPEAIATRLAVADDRVLADRYAARMAAVGTTDLVLKIPADQGRC